MTRAWASAPLFAALLAGCAYNSELGRSQAMVVSEASLTSQAAATWNQAMRSSAVSADTAMNRRVRAVGRRIVEAAGLGDQAWDYAVFDDPTPNAFVLPGGKVGVNAGLLRFVENDDQLAAVLGHEVGHILARHAAERYSQTVLAEVGVGAARLALGDPGSRYGVKTQDVLGAGVRYGVLMPYSRRHELEADRIGVDLMVRAGYRPGEAVRLWERMAAADRGANPEMLSTHPSDQSRVAALVAYLNRREPGPSPSASPSGSH